MYCDKQHSCGEKFHSAHLSQEYSTQCYIQYTVYSTWCVHGLCSHMLSVLSTFLRQLVLTIQPNWVWVGFALASYEYSVFMIPYLITVGTEAPGIASWLCLYFQLSFTSACSKDSCNCLFTCMCEHVRESSEMKCSGRYYSLPFGLVTPVHFFSHLFFSTHVIIAYTHYWLPLLYDTFYRLINEDTLPTR